MTKTKTETVVAKLERIIKGSDNLTELMQEEIAKGTSEHIHFLSWRGFEQMRLVIWKGIAEDGLARYERLQANGNGDKFGDLFEESARKGLLTQKRNSTNPSSNLMDEFKLEFYQRLFDTFDGIFEV